MGWQDAPMPAAVATRPRDPRGFPIPAITPWVGGEPRFASTGVARTFLCAVERRCGICALTMPAGPVWRVVGGVEAEAMAAALAAGRDYRNGAPTAEAPGHRACMLYAAAVCPWLSIPTARRADPTLKGTRRPPGGAVVSFAAGQFRFDGSQVGFRFAGLGEFCPYEQGEDLLTTIAAAVAVQAAVTEPQPPYLLADEAAAQARFTAYVTRPG